MKCLVSLFFYVPDPRETCILPVNTVSPCLSAMIDDPYRWCWRYLYLFSYGTQQVVLKPFIPPYTCHLQVCVCVRQDSGCRIHWTMAHGAATALAFILPSNSRTGEFGTLHSYRCSEGVECVHRDSSAVREQFSFVCLTLLSDIGNSLPHNSVKHLKRLAFINTALSGQFKSHTVIPLYGCHVNYVK